MSNERRVFVSSTFRDLMKHREAVRKAIRLLDADDIAMEHFGARGNRPKGECERLIRDESDLFIGIYAHRYGFVPTGDDMSITEGNQFSFISRVIPDINFRETVDTSSMDFIMETKSFPGQADQNSSTNTVSKTSSTPVDQYTNQYFTRLRGRSFTLKLQSTDANVLWRLGVPRVDIRPDGRR